MSPPIKIAFDEISFLFGAGSGMFQVDLLINGLTVRSLRRDEVQPGEIVEVRWPVYPWRGAIAQLRIRDLSPVGHFAFDHFRSEIYPSRRSFSALAAPSFATADTEAATRFHWPVLETTVELAQAYGPHLLLNNATVSWREPAPLSWSSPELPIESDFVSFVVFDFGGAETRIQLVEGETILREFVGLDSQALTTVTWSVGSLRGRTLSIRLVDRDSDPLSWIGVAEIAQFDRAPE